MENAQLIREEAAELEAQQQAMVAELETRNEKAFSDEEMEAFDDLEARKEELFRQADSLERVQKLSKREDIFKAVKSKHITRKAGPSKKDADLALRSVLANGVESRFANLEEWREAGDKLNLRNGSSEFTIRMLSESDLIEKRDQSTTAVEGGYSISDGIVVGFEKALANYWNWGDIVTMHRTASHTPLTIVTNNDTSNEGAYLDELTAVSNTSMTFARTVLNAYKIASGVFPVSNELLEDSEINISAIVADGLAERLGRKLSREITNGDGNTGHLRGFTNDTVTGVTADYTDGFAWDDLIDLYFSVDEAYRSNARWMMSSSTLAFICKLVDSYGRPLYMPFNDPLVGAPRLTLMGKEVIINDWLDSAVPGTPGLGDQVVYFGDFSKIHVRMVRDITTRVSNEKYFLEDAVAMISTLRADAKLLNAGTNPVKHLRLNTSSGAPSVND